MHPLDIAARDHELIQIVDAALADATRRSLRPDGTSWLACRPGCTPCCHGVFRIAALDAERLRRALADLRTIDPLQAAAVEHRARAFVGQLAAVYPGESETGILEPEDEAWDAFADHPAADAPCPVLDPATGRCTLYAGRPLTCRVFGPPVANEGGIGICELCYVGADTAEVLAGEMVLKHHALEAELHTALPEVETVIAWALLQPPATL